MAKEVPSWAGTLTLNPMSFKCGNCGLLVEPTQGLKSNSDDRGQHRFVYFCTSVECRYPMLFIPSVDNKGRVTYDQFPSPPTSRAIEHLPKPEVDRLWNEVRDAAKSGAATVAVMGCRALLHHIAFNAAAGDDDVSEKQAANFTFQQSVDYLETNGFLPPNSRDWVDEVRKKGNVANHDLVLMDQNDVSTVTTPAAS
jgi:hypothetical protein